MKTKRTIFLVALQILVVAGLLVSASFLTKKVTEPREYGELEPIPVGNSFVGVGVCSSEGFLTYCDQPHDIAGVAQVLLGETEPSPQAVLDRCIQIGIVVPPAGTLKAVFTGSVIECQIHFTPPTN